MIDIANALTFPDAERRSKASTMAEAEQRQRAAMMARRFPATSAGPLLGLGQGMNIISEAERTAAHSLAPSRLARREAEQRARLDRLPAPVRDAQFPLTLLGREVLAVVYRANRAAGDQPSPMPRVELAKAVGVAHDHAERLLGELVKLGAIKEYPGFGPGTVARYRAVP